MRNVLVFVVWLACVAGVSAQTYVEKQVTVNPDSTVLESRSLATIDTGGTLDLAMFYVVNKDWGELVVGPAYNHESGVGASVLVGVETHNQGYWRVNPNIWLYRGRFGGLQILEWGASGFWYQTRVTWTLHPNLQVGVHSQRFLGTGPLVQVPVKTWMAWSSVLMAGGNAKFAVGVRKNF
jgi:hypothetical protein